MARGPGFEFGSFVHGTFFLLLDKASTSLL